MFTQSFSTLFACKTRFFLLSRCPLPECSQAALLVLRHVTVVPPDGEEEEHYRVLMRLIHDLSFRLVSAKVLASRDVPLPNLVERFMILFSRKVDGSGWRTCADMVYQIFLLSVAYSCRGH